MNWLYWRPVVEGLGTILEVRRQWTLEDLMDAHEVLDTRQRQERDILQRAKRGRV